MAITLLQCFNMCLGVGGCWLLLPGSLLHGRPDAVWWQHAVLLHVALCAASNVLLSMGLIWLWGREWMGLNITIFSPPVWWVLMLLHSLQAAYTGSKQLTLDDAGILIGALWE